MRFCWVTISVKDMKKSLSFYQDILGLTLIRNMKPNPSMEISFLGKGDTQVELIYSKENSLPAYGADISLGFEVDSLDEMSSFLASKDIGIQAGPFQPNPHIRFLYILDPDGLKIQLVENIK